MERVDALQLIELGAVILGLALLARLAHRFGISPIPLYLLAGLAFGDGGIAPLAVTGDFIALGSELGLILLLFMLGLEHSARELVVSMRSSGRVALLDTTLNFAPGLVAGLLLGWGIIPALFLGGVTLVTSSGIAAKVLQDFHWDLGAAGPIVVSILVFEDLQMAIFLPILAGLVAGGATVAGLTTAAAALIAVAILLAISVRVEVGVSRALFSKSDEALLLTIFGLAILLAGVAELVTISAAVGALLVGIMLSGPAAQGARPLLKPLRDVFAAMFFVFIGLQVDPSSLPPVIPLAIALAIVGVATKFITGWVGSGWKGLPARERWRVAIALIPRGEFSLAIAGLGAAAGLEPELATVAVAYVFVLAVVGPVAARFVDARTSRADQLS